MFNFLVGKQVVTAPRLPKSARQSDHTDHFVQHHIGSVNKSLFASFATGDFTGSFAWSAKDVAFAALKQIITTKFTTKATAQKGHQVIILEESIHADSRTGTTCLRHRSQRLRFGLEHLFFFLERALKSCLAKGRTERSAAATEVAAGLINTYRFFCCFSFFPPTSDHYKMHLESQVAMQV